MKIRLKYKRLPGIKTAEDLGIALLGNPRTAVVSTPYGRQIDRAEYGRRLAAAEGGRFTPFGYIAPIKEGPNNVR